MPTNEAIERVERCPACHEPLVRVEDGRPDDNVHCGCTVVSLEWLRLAKPTPTPPADVVELLSHFESAVRVNENHQGTTDRLVLEISNHSVREARAKLLAAIPAAGECDRVICDMAHAALRSIASGGEG